MSVTVPIRVVSDVNGGGKLRARIARKRATKASMGWALRALEASPKTHEAALQVAAYAWAGVPLEVKLTRIAPRQLDDDNLRGALKTVRDCIAKWLGVDDKRRELVSYEYDQERRAPGQYAVRIEIARKGEA